MFLIKRCQKTLKLAILAIALPLAPLSNMVTLNAYAAEGEAGSIYDTELINSVLAETDGHSVKFTKTAEDVGDGLVNITLKAEGPVHEIAEKPEVYVVVVVDRSASMTTEKWNAARSGAVSFANNLIGSEYVDAYVSSVLFGTTATTATAFRNTTFSNADFPPDNNQYTNMQDGINKAVSALQSAPEGAHKYIVILGDGIPTACNQNADDCTNVSDLPGTTIGSCNASYYCSSNPAADNQPTTFSEAAYRAAEAIPSDISVMTIGYDTEGKPGAQTVLRTIASNPSYFYTADTNSIMSVFNQLAVEASQVPAGHKAIATDIIGNDFIFVQDLSGDTAANYAEAENGDKVVTCNFDTLTQAGTSCKFQIKVTAPIKECSLESAGIEEITSEWLNTNVAAQLDYEALFTLDEYEKAVLLDEPSETSIVISDSPEYRFTASVAYDKCPTPPCEYDPDILSDDPSCTEPDPCKTYGGCGGGSDIEEEVKEEETKYYFPNTGFFSQTNAATSAAEAVSGAPMSTAVMVSLIGTLFVAKRKAVKK